MSSNIPGTAGPGGESVAGSPEEVVDPAPRPVRRSFTAEYRARVVAEYEAAPRGEKGGVLWRVWLVSVADPGMDRGPRRGSPRSAGTSRRIRSTRSSFGREALAPLA